MRRILLVVAVAALMAAMMVVNVAPAFAAPWWKDGDVTYRPTETLNCTWGWGTGHSGKLPCYATE
jgi:hypothetical protein